MCLIRRVFVVSLYRDLVHRCLTLLVRLSVYIVTGLDSDGTVPME